MLFRSDLVRGGADIAGANRLGFGRPSTMPLANYVMNVVLSKIASVRSRCKVLDVHSGQRAYRRDILHAFSWRYEFEAFPIDLIFVPATCGYTVVEVPIEYRERIGETTLQRWPSGKASIKRLTRTKKSIRGSLLIPPRG